MRELPQAIRCPMTKNGFLIIAAAVTGHDGHEPFGCRKERPRRKTVERSGTVKLDEAGGQVLILFVVNSGELELGMRTLE